MKFFSWSRYFFGFSFLVLVVSGSPVQTEKTETEVRDIDRKRKHIGVRKIFQGVLLSIPFTKHYIHSPPADRPSQ
jgi:hypothetical protein